MIQGCTSDAGKSTLVTGLCRALKNKGIDVAPFKPQNMALNSAVTKEGGEIGRSQAVQAAACKLEPSIHMNPILIKPNSHTDAQVVVQGKALINLSAEDYMSYKKKAHEFVIDSYEKLSTQHEYIIVEGAGSPAEINLRANDIANMGFAEAVDCPVILVADIDRGGVFAHLCGTLDLLSESEQSRVIGFVINRFRGDINLLTDGLEWLEQKTGKPVLGVLPYLNNFYLDAEDALQKNTVKNDAKFSIAVIIYPQVSNHTDFDHIALQENVQLDFYHVSQGNKLQNITADLVILPGSKNVRSDLQALIENNWQNLIVKHLRYGGKLMGICGGYQMLGNTINDPLGLEGTAGSSAALGLIDSDCTLQDSKTLTNVSALLNTNLFDSNKNVSGYEIHLGSNTIHEYDYTHFASINGNSKENYKEGYISKDRQIIGTYLHGVFDTGEALQALLNWAGMDVTIDSELNEIREQNIERIAQCVESHLDMEKLLTSSTEFYKQLNLNQSKITLSN